jgi:hypothetical protein
MVRFARLTTAEVIAMTWGYYAFVIDDEGHVFHRIEVLCDDDDEAIRRVEPLADGHVIELWQEKRKIATFQPKE